jgi:hypothetical protein
MGDNLSDYQWEQSQRVKTTAELISEECSKIEEMLIEKNRAYGDSALTPIRVFSKADTLEQIKVRLDDKLSRLARGKEAGEDVILDLIGYLILYRVHQVKGKL